MTDKKKIVVLTHGGAGSNPDYADGTAIAGQISMMSLKEGEAIIDAACQAVTTLEDDGRFNAGIGSHKRNDGTVEMLKILGTLNIIGDYAVLHHFIT